MSVGLVEEQRHTDNSLTTATQCINCDESTGLRLVTQQEGAIQLFAAATCPFLVIVVSRALSKELKARLMRLLVWPGATYMGARHGH